MIKLNFDYEDIHFAEKLADPYAVMKQAKDDIEVYVALKKLEEIRSEK